MADAPYSGRFTRLLLEGLGHYRRGDMVQAMSSWEAAYHVEAGNTQAREFLRTALLRLNVQLGREEGRAHPWLLPPEDAGRTPGEASPWDQGPSRALQVEAQTARIVPRDDDPVVNTPPPRPPWPGRSAASLPTPPTVRRIAPPFPGADEDELTVVPLDGDPAETWAAIEREVTRVETERLAENTTRLLRQARERVARRDFGGASELTAKVLAREPGHPEATLLSHECEAGLAALYQAALGSLAAQPRVIATEEQVRGLGLQRNAASLLSRIDGQLTFEELFDASGLSRVETAKILSRLMRAGIIGLTPA